MNAEFDTMAESYARPDLPTVLVAEDIDSNFILVEILLRKDYNIVRAHNGLEAVAVFRQLRPGLILMDIQMPVMNGLDATRQIREIDADIPILALTAFAFDSDREDFFKAGGTDYIVKPLDPHQLKNKVKEYLF